MKSRNRFALSLWLALAASTCLTAPSLAQSVAARSGHIAELSKNGKYAEAIPLAEKLLADMEKTYGPAHRDVAGALNNLGQIYASTGRDAEAEPLYRRALSIFEKTVGLDSVEVASTLNNLAALYQRQERFADAEPLFKRALAIRERSLGASHPDLAQSLNNMATHYEKQGRHRGRNLAQQSRPGRQGSGPLCGSRADDQALAGDPRKSAGGRTSRCCALAEQSCRSL